MRRKRKMDFPPDETTLVHVTHRCVRQAFLMDDRLRTAGIGKTRRQIILDHLKLLSSAFAIDLFRLSIMTNHIHITMRNRPDIVERWSDKEVARRWLIICPGYSRAHYEFRGKVALPVSDQEIEKLAADKERIQILRERLSDISTFMWAFSDYVAKLFNLVDGKKGCFWEGRFKARLVLDEVGLLTCGLYVDLNPIRAGAAKTPEESWYTTACFQIEAERRRVEEPAVDPSTLPDAFFSPVALSGEGSAMYESSTGQRVSDFGFLSISDKEYLIILDLVGRIIRDGKAGVIDENIPPIFERLKSSFESVSALVLGYQELFRSFVGTQESINRRTRVRQSKCAAS